jgi:hypothetical protein
MPVPPSSDASSDQEAFELPDGTFLTEERAAETGQQVIDKALQRRPSAAA